MKVIPVEEIEEVFWSLMQKEEDIEIQTAQHLTLPEYRPKFLMKKQFSREISEKSWGFSEIASNSENMLSYIGSGGRRKFDPTL